MGRDSRATAVLVGAVKTAMDKILIKQLDARHRPCNFAEMLPRIRGED